MSQNQGLVYNYLKLFNWEEVHRFHLLAPSNCKVLNFDHVLPPYNLNEALINFVKQFLQASIFSCQDDQER